MIIVALNGGLGNQMFQYATGLAVASRLDTEMKYDNSFLFKYRGDKITKREFLLHHFNISAKRATNAEIRKHTLPRLENKYMDYLFRKIKREKNVITQKEFHYTNILQSCKPDTYIRGNWQSEKYFIDIQDKIRKEFIIIRQSLSSIKKNTYYNKILQSNSVAVHIRRGDYIKYNNEFVVLKHDYYKSAIDKISTRVDDAKYFIFSDDSSWCISQFSDKKYNIIDGNSSVDDFILMSQCKHNIIANSSYSWWAAWLNSNPNKVVIAPDEWFVDKQINTNDLYPKEWIRII